MSETGDPSGAYNVYPFDMKGTTTNSADYTMLGYEANGMYFSGQMFSSAAGSFQNAKICGVPKLKMENGVAVIAHCSSNFKAGGAIADTVQPADGLAQRITSHEPSRADAGVIFLPSPWTERRRAPTIGPP